ncbi:MAG: methionyl-tRNA formyltransferase [Caulobacteraceae bacterium]
MRLAFLGTPRFSVPTLTALIEAGHEVACVWSQPAAPRGRGQTVRPGPVQTFAQARGIAVRTPVSLRAPEEVAAFRALGLDAAIVVAFGQILVREVLEAPRLGCFNLHASLLPRWRGAAPIQRSIMAGDAVTGVEVMRMGEGLDDGPVLARATTPIGPLDTAGTLQDRLATAGAALMIETLADIARGTAVETPQPAEGATRARKIRTAEARIDWTLPAARIDRKIRGLSPFPGAWFTLASGRGPVRVKALLSRVEAADGEAGVALDDGLAIACGTASVRLLAVQREGRGAQAAADFLRGFPVLAGARLG